MEIIDVGNQFLQEWKKEHEKYNENNQFVNNNKKPEDLEYNWKADPPDPALASH